MHLCTCVIEEGGDGDGVGKGEDSLVVALSLELSSLDTHRREVSGAHGTLVTEEGEGGDT